MLRQTPQILLVEEDPLLSEITAFRLELLGYEVVKVTTAELAIGNAAIGKSVLCDVAGPCTVSDHKRPASN